MKTTRRIARKMHRCNSCASPNIEPGHVYLVHTIFPSDDISAWNHPQRSTECADCAIRYGREWELHPVPDDQPYRYWLGDVAPEFDSPVGSSKP